VNATGALTIPIIVTSVAAGALAGCTLLTSVTYYSTTSIGADAFTGVPSVIVLYTDGTFLYSSDSKTVLTGIVGGVNATGALTIPITVTSVAAGALAGCTKLTSISYYSTTTVDPTSFTGVRKVNVLYTDRTFIYTSSSKNYIKGLVGGVNATGALTIPITVTSVAAGALAGCTKLTSVTYYSTTTIGTGAFTGVKKVIAVYTDGKFLYSSSSKAYITGVLATTGAFPAIPTTVVTGILDNAFKNSKLTSTSLTIPKNVKTVGKSAFAGCTGIKAITYYSSTTKVDTTSFTGIAKVNVLRAMLDVKRLAMRFPVLKSN
jgi:outer membrane protein assembly factor BamE (lipoprotein component of BamABCDE complex)